MKLLLLRVLLQRRAKDEGFTLPIVIALGLIMILLGAVNILGAGEENLNAISDNQRNKALAIAEVGVARYRELLDRNRMLTVFSSDQWSSLTNTCDINADISSAANTNWQQVSDGSGNIGQYRIVSYVYDIDDDVTTINNNQFAPNSDNQSNDDAFTFNDLPGTVNNPITSGKPSGLPYNPKGVLTIKSQANDGSEAQVEVEIPIRINQGDMSNLDPALWIGNYDKNNTDFGDLRLGNNSTLGEPGDPNIVISQPASGSNAGCQNKADLEGDAKTTGNNVITDPRPLPAIIDPDSFKDPGIPVADRLDDSKRNNINTATFNTDEILGKPTDTRWKEQTWSNGQSTSYYFYEKPNDLIVDGATLVSDGSARVFFYVKGSKIELINRAKLDAGGNYASSILFEIYGDNSVDEIIFDPNGQTIDITGFIHAPNATVKVKGTGTVNIKGAMWVKDWKDESGGSVAVTINTDNAGFASRKSYEYYLGTDNRAAKPITDAPTDWEVQEVADEPTTTPATP